MRYLILSLGIIGFSIFVQNNNTSLTSLGMEPVCDTEHQFYKIILGSNLDHIQNQRIAYAKNNHTNNTKYIFIGAGFAESMGLFSLVIALILLFV